MKNNVNKYFEMINEMTKTYKQKKENFENTLKIPERWSNITNCVFGNR